MKQTAVDYLQDEILQDRMIKAKSIKEWNDVISKAREMEKQQIIKSNRDGVDMVVDKKPFIMGEEYYNETYGSKGSDENHAYCGIIDCKCTTSSQTEISDEEIEKEAELSFGGNDRNKSVWVNACKWYREQLKKKI